MIKPYKNRKIDLSKPVEVYRNLNQPGVTYSIRQNNKVVGHGIEFGISDCIFIVKESGRKRALKSKSRNVHAWIVGKIAEMEEGGFEIKYNPFKFSHFYIEGDPGILTKAYKICFTGKGVFGNIITIE